MGGSSAAPAASYYQPSQMPQTGPWNAPDQGINWVGQKGTPGQLQFTIPQMRSAAPGSPGTAGAVPPVQSIPGMTGSYGAQPSGMPGMPLNMILGSLGQMLGGMQMGPGIQFPPGMVNNQAAQGGAVSPVGMQGKR